MLVCIIGASSGIGGAFVDLLSDRPDVDRIIAFSRAGTSHSSAKVEDWRMDITNEASIKDAADQLKTQGAPDLVIVASGLLSDREDLQPEKSYRQQSFEAFEQVFAVNTFGPAMVARYFLPLMPRKTRNVFAVLSARVGSISDNRIGGWHAYRASKAALNMLLKNYAIEQARRSDQFIAVGLHPGTVDTDLSKPFQGNVPDKQLFSPEQSAKYLMSVIDGLTPEDSGLVFDWAGEVVPA